MIDRLVRAVSMGTAMFIAIRSHYAWYWQVAIVITVVTAGYGIGLAIQSVLAPRNK